VVRRPPSCDLSGFPQSGRRAFESRLTLVASPVLCLLESPARRSFKDMAGHINHFLITILIGLAAVEDGTATLPPGMHTSWAPHNRTRSAARSREFANKAFLAWLADALDAYIRGLQSEPSLASAKIIEGIERANREQEGLRGRLRVVSAATEQLEAPEAILAEMAIVWRNRLVHQQATNRIGSPLTAAARGHSEEFINLYQGLVIDDLIKHVQHVPSAAPTLKEATAIVRASHTFVERSDGFLLQRFDVDSYFREVLRRYLVSGGTSNPKAAKVRAGNVWSREYDRRRSTIINIALNSGFSSYRAGAPNQVDSAAIDKLAKLTPSDAIAELGISQST
jgi:hypothetical protein